MISTNLLMRSSSRTRMLMSISIFPSQSRCDRRTVALSKRAMQLLVKVVISAAASLDLNRAHQASKQASKPLKKQEMPCFSNS